MTVDGRGVLITGESGCGKSETALGLLDRGHRLVADDAVTIERTAAGDLQGSCPPALRGRLEVRGLGILDVRALFGPQALQATTPLALEVALQRADRNGFAEWPRLEPHLDRRPLLGEPLPRLILPLSGSRPLPLLIETAVRHYLPQQMQRQTC